MKLQDVDFVRLLPVFMQSDSANKGFSEGINPVIKDLSAKLKLFTTWDKIDDMTEAELDELAWELNISWYYLANDIEAKRRTVRESDLVYSRLATKWAVTEVVTTIFGSGSVREWFEYGGEPHHFKIISGNPSLTNERIEQFFEMLETVKRKSSWLDAILITLTGEMSLYMGAAFKDTNREVHIMGSQDSINLFYGTLLYERANEIHTIKGGTN